MDEPENSVAVRVTNAPEPCATALNPHHRGPATLVPAQGQPIIQTRGHPGPDALDWQTLRYQSGLHPGVSTNRLFANLWHSHGLLVAAIQPSASELTIYSAYRRGLPRRGRRPLRLRQPAPPTATAAPAARPAAATTSTPKTSRCPTAARAANSRLSSQRPAKRGWPMRTACFSLDGADPGPVLPLKNVQNPLARALQDAHLAIQRARAKPPKMAAPSVPAAPAPVGRQRPVPPRARGTRAQESPSRPAAASARPAGPPAPPKQAAPVDQPALF